MYIDIEYEQWIYHFIIYSHIAQAPKVQIAERYSDELRYNDIPLEDVPEKVLGDLKFYSRFVSQYY